MWPNLTLVSTALSVQILLWVAHDPTDGFVAIIYIVIVITTATALVSANEGEGGLGHF
jgi:hypothetical protein